MKSVLQPWQLVLLILAGWINRRQQDAIEYLMTENRVLREKLGMNRILLNDDQRRRLAVKGKMLEQLATIVTPDTILRWHRKLVARHWDYSGHRKYVGRRCRRKLLNSFCGSPGNAPPGAMTGYRGRWRI